MIKGVIFDYNGTIFFDNDINYEAWKKMYEQIVGDDGEFDPIYNTYGSTNNTLFLKTLYEKANKPYDLELINKKSFEKETLYHEICIRDKRNKLAPGAEELFEYLLNKGIKINISTASIKYNVDFYFENCNLGKYFNKELLGYDTNNNTNKVDLYKLACKNIEVEPKDCLSFDDSINSINDSIKAGINNIIRINYENKPKIDKKEILFELKDFSELDYSKLDRILL